MSKTTSGLVFSALIAATMVLGPACGPDVVSVYVDGATPDASFDVQRDVKPDVKFDAGDAEVSFNLWPPSVGPIVRRSGRVMLDVPNVYLIWYGDWSSSKAPVIVDNFFHDVNDSDWMAMSADYWMSVQVIDRGPSWVRPSYVSGHVNLAQSINVGFPLGNDVGIDGIRTTVTDALDQQKLPYDENGIYYVLTSANVKEGGWNGFCGAYCGWHDHVVHDGKDIKFVFVGDPQAQCANGCTMQDRAEATGANTSPNGDWGADAMMSVVAHELTETLTDPDIDAWYDQFMYENADMCAWRFEPVYKTDAGAIANVHMGTHDYMIQQNWTFDADAGTGGRCDLHK